MHIFGAVCPARATTAALVMPRINAKAMDFHLKEIADAVVPGAHAILILDGAGWHDAKALDVPHNITLLKLPPYSPELNPMENVRACLRSNRLAHAVLDTIEDITDWSSPGFVDSQALSI